MADPCCDLFISHRQYLSGPWVEDDWSASCLLSIFSSLSYFPIRSVTPQFSPTHWLVLPWLQHWSTSCSLHPSHCPRCCLNLGTLFVPSAGELGTRRKWAFFFPKVGTSNARENMRIGLKEEAWRLAGLKNEWINAVLKVCHCREDVKGCSGGCVPERGTLK